jgi:hypothetical protein
MDLSQLAKLEDGPLAIRQPEGWTIRNSLNWRMDLSQLAKLEDGPLATR